MSVDIKQHGIIVEAETRKCTVEIYLNDIPVGLCGVGGSRKLTRPDGLSEPTGSESEPACGLVEAD